MGDSLVKFECEKDKLENVDRAKELEFKGPVVPDAPDADGDGHDADKDEGNKNEDPVVAARLEVVRDEELEHEK
jgi:hypothetical protein